MSDPTRDPRPPAPLPDLRSVLFTTLLLLYTSSVENRAVLDCIC
jgi:hypothetical protein